MEIDDFKDFCFSAEQSFSLPCPSCNGSVVFQKDLFSSHKDFISILNANNPDWEDTFICKGELICHNCGCTIVFTGIGYYYDYDYFDENEHQYKIDYCVHYKPTFFEPAIHLFKIPTNTPNVIKNEIINSFKLFWCSKEACANSCRKTIELLFDERQIKPNRDLKTRINDFNKIHPEAGNYLEALRCMGNAGSHNDNIVETDILGAYKLLKFSIEKLYSTGNDNLNDIFSCLIENYKPKKNDQK